MSEAHQQKGAQTGADVPAALPGRVLIVRPSALGDVCRSVPLLAQLRLAWPGARIDWLVQDSFAPAVAWHPALTAHGGGVVAFARKHFARLWHPGVALELARWLRGLARARYDVAIDAQGLLRSALFARATGARVRVGEACAREGAARLYTLRVPPCAGVHAVDRMLSLLPALGVPVPATPDMRLYAAPEDTSWAARHAGLAGRFALLAPTTRWPAKQWPAERYAALARALLDRGLVERVVIVGGRGEESQCPQLLGWAQGDARALNLLGATTLGQLMAIVQRATVLVGSDSAAVHMAVGFDRPLVALYGPTDVARVGPYLRGHDVLQHVKPGEAMDHKAPGHDSLGRAQMARISTDEVIEACAQRLR